MKILEIENKKRQYYRWIVVAIIGLAEIFAVYYYFEQVNNYLNQIAITSKSIELIKPLVAIIFAAPIAFLVWVFKNHDRQRDIEQRERDLNLKENNDAWDNLVKFQDVVNDKTATDAKKATAIYGLGEFYNHKDFKFAHQVHALFRGYLEEFWNQDNSDKYAFDPPEYIKAIHETIRRQSNKKRDGNFFFHKDNKLNFHVFQLQRANLVNANFVQADFIQVNLTYAHLHSTNFTKANLDSATLSGAYLDDANFIKANLDSVNFDSANLDKTNFTSAYMINADFSEANLNGANFYNANLCNADLSASRNLNESKLKKAIHNKNKKFPTKFPEDFNPEEHGMIEIIS